MPLKYVGPNPANARDLATASYISSLGSANLVQATVDTLVNSAFAPYYTRVTVDAGDANLADQTFVDAGDATRLHLAQIGQVNGVAGLDTTGRIPVANINISSTQRYPASFSSPAAYYSANQSTGASELLLHTIDIADPGFTYKLLVFGTLDSYASSDGNTMALIRVRQGSTSGPLVGIGTGARDNYLGGVMTFYGPGNYTYDIPTWAGTVDEVAMGGGGGGHEGGNFFLVLNGAGGGAGGWATNTIVRGSTLPPTTSQLSVSVPFPSGGQGGTTVISGAGTPTLAAGGGARGVSSVPGGIAPGYINYNGNLYVGGNAGGGLGGIGGTPGAGGNGGGYGAVTPNPGGAGGGGGAWLFASPSPSSPPRGPALISPWPINGQPALTGPTTLYVMGFAGGTPTVGFTTVRPNLCAFPIPA